MARLIAQDGGGDRAQEIRQGQSPPQLPVLETVSYFVIMTIYQSFREDICLD
jgi:hypothetical protein